MENKKTNNRRIWVYLAVVFLMGAVPGCLKETWEAEKLLREGIILPEWEILLRYIGSNGVLLFLCWAWGYFLPLFPLACLAVGYKAYTMTAVAMTALRAFGKKGMVFYMAGVLPHNAALLFLISFACVQSARLPYLLRESDEGYRRERCVHGLKAVTFAFFLCVAALGEVTIFTEALNYLRT